jgi:Na+/H+ antiporter NhaD/arsenite permease-like protein
MWAVLVGVNFGPVVLASGSLSTLLWLRTVRSLGIEVTAARFTTIGLRIGLPAFGAAGAVRLFVGMP